MARSEPGKPKQKRSEQTRRKLIEAGIREFSTVGYHATSSKRIARVAGIAVGTFYNHFQDKKALLLEIQQGHSERVHALIGERLSGLDTGHLAEDGRAAVRSIIAQVVAAHDLAPEIHREITALRHLDPEFEAISRQNEELAVALLIALLEPHRDLLRVDDLEAAAHVIEMTMEAVIHGIKMFEPSIADQRLTDALADMTFRYLYRDS